MSKDPDPKAPAFLSDGTRDYKGFRKLCQLAGIGAMLRLKTVEPHWVLKDLRKTSATFYDEYVPESFFEHSARGFTHRTMIMEHHEISTDWRKALMVNDRAADNHSGMDDGST